MEEEKKRKSYRIRRDTYADTMLRGLLPTIFTSDAQKVTFRRSKKSKDAWTVTVVSPKEEA